jgi:hypothetical protein
MIRITKGQIPRQLTAVGVAATTLLESETRDEIIVLKNLSIADPAEITEVAKMIRDRRTELLIAQRSNSPFSAMAKRFLQRNPIP